MGASAAARLRGGWSPAARFLVPVAPFLALAVPRLLTARHGVRIAAIVIAAQLAIDGLLWGRPMTMWSEGPGPAPFLQAMAGRAFAAWFPVWETLAGPVLLASVAGLGLCAALTRALVIGSRRP